MHETKFKIVKRKETGKDNTTIRQELGLAKSTVGKVWKNREASQMAVKTCGTSQLDTRRRVDNPSMVLMQQYSRSTRYLTNL